MLKFYGVVLKRFLEPQLLFLRWYERWLEHGVADGSMEDRQRQMVKAMMSAYLDAAQSMPGYGERVSRSQAEMIKAYRETVEDLLRHVDRPR